MHSFAYESPTNCFEVTIKRTTDERKGLEAAKDTWVTFQKSFFYIFGFIFLNKEKGTKSYPQSNV